MNALIVDDERLARSELKRLLAAHPDITVVGEAGNVDEAETRLRELPVDVLFLDIQMPGGTGFDLLERLDDVPVVVFTTAFDQHAVHAFEVNAFDYLLKPIRPERLAQTLDRTRARWTPQPAPSAAPSAPRRVFVRDGERCWLVDPAEIALLESDGNYTRVHFGSNRPLVPRTLQSLEARLDPVTFFRASRGSLVNLKMVEGVETGVDGAYVVILKGGRRVDVSRRQSKKLRETLSL